MVFSHHFQPKHDHGVIVLVVFAAKNVVFVTSAQIKPAWPRTLFTPFPAVTWYTAALTCMYHVTAGQVKTT